MDKTRRHWQDKLYIVIFESDTPAGRAFDLALIGLVFLSSAAIVLESVETIKASHYTLLRVIEWVSTLLFTIEYGLRVASSRERYILSFYGLVDLFSIIPFYISVFVPGMHYLSAIRILRTLRVIQVLKLTRFMGESITLSQAIYRSRFKITVFLGTVMTLVLLIAVVIYLVEGRENGFTSIPKAMYWAIVTLTTVGYGDIAPKTPLGQTIASLVMLMGYGVIAVPTGIVTYELSQGARSEGLTCPSCKGGGHDKDAGYCKHCGNKLQTK